MDIKDHIKKFLDENKNFKKNNLKLDDEAMKYVVALKEEGFSWVAVVAFLKQELNITVSENTVACRFSRDSRASKIKPQIAVKKEVATEKQEFFGKHFHDNPKADVVTQALEETLRKKVAVGEIVTINDKAYKRIAPDYISSDAELEARLDKLEEDIINGVVTNLQKVHPDTWYDLVRRYEPSERYRNMIGEKIDVKDLSEAERYNYFVRLMPLQRPYVFLEPLKAEKPQ